MITYYAIARNPKGQVAQLFVTRLDGRQVSQTWTGKTYIDEEAGLRDCEKLNCP